MFNFQFAICLTLLALNVSAADWPLRGNDLKGQAVTLGTTPGCRGVVVAFLATECPISNESLPKLNRLAERFRAEKIGFYGVISNPGVTRAEAVKHAESYRIGFPVLFDASGLLREQLQPTHTPQVFVIDAAGRVRYSGRFDDRYVALGNRKPAAERHYLEEALASLIAGTAVSVERTEPIGCLLESPQREHAQAEVTYCRDIAPLLNSRCVNCHRPDGPAPFSLMSYEDAAKRARQIRLVTESQFMPPWKPRPEFGHFRDERRLSEREIALLARWAEAGAPRGHVEDLPPAPEFPHGWQLGEPDLVVTMPEAFTVPGDGGDIYQYFVLPSGLVEHRFVAAIEFRPGNPRAVHHASFLLDISGQARELDAADPNLGYRRFGGPGFEATGTLGGWAPGVTPPRLPDGTGRPMPRGSDIIFQIHYHPTGKPETDQSSLALYFAPGKTKQLVMEMPVANLLLDIPAGAARHSHRAEYVLPVNTSLLAASPHMHLLGREIKATATLPDGRVEPLLWITDWDFNWQSVYAFAQPIRLPRGTQITVETWFDNSADNPRNPHSPPRRVRWGEESTDEMGVCFFDVVADSPADGIILWQDHRLYLDKQRRTAAALR